MAGKPLTTDEEARIRARYRDAPGDDVVSRFLATIDQARAERDAAQLDKMALGLEVQALREDRDNWKAVAASACRKLDMLSNEVQ